LVPVIVCAALVSRNTVRAGAEPDVPPQAVAALTAFLRESVTKGDVPGVVAMVVTKDRVVYEASAGKRDVGRGLDMAPDTIFRIASMTKPLTTLAALMLVEDGRLALDADISTYLPAFATPKVLTQVNEATGTIDTRPSTKRITVRHLLTHTSGIGYSWSNPELAAAQRITKATSDSELPLVHEPGARWTYGASTRVVGDIVQRVTGQRIDAFLQARLFAPLGMRETAFDVEPSKHARVVTVHQRTSGRLAEVPNSASLATVVRGDGGLYSTAADYAKFIQLVLNRGMAGGTRLVKASTIDLMLTPQMGALKVGQQPAADAARSRPFPTGVGEDTWGFGFQIAAPTVAVANARRPGSVTWAGINNTHFFIDPATGLGVMVLMQVLPFYDAGALRVFHGFEERLYGGLTRAHPD
jgi:CubicO group peptidase (beta-lactamase class C family)